MAERPDDSSSEARELAGRLGAIDAFAHLDSLQLLEFERVADVAAIGYEQSLLAIREWLESRECDGF